MNLLLVIFNANPSNGGAERYTADLAAGLLARGHSVTIACAVPHPNPPSNLQQITLGANGLTRNAKYKSFLNSLDQLLSAQKFDRVHAMLPVRQCDLYHPHAGIEWDWMSRGVKWIKRFANPRRFAVAKVESQLLQTHAKVICLSDYIKRQLQTHYNLTQDRLRIAYNGVDLSRFTPGAPKPEIREKLGIPANAPLGLMVAMDFERKGLPQTLIAMRQMQNKAMHLVVAGKGKINKYLAMARVFDVADRVHFVGKIPNVIDFYRASDFFVLPTQHDPCSLVVLEALATGLPILTTVQNGAGELAGPAGIILDNPKNTRDIAKALDALCVAETRNSMRADCLKLREGLSQEKHLDQIIKIYSEGLTL